MILIIDNYDSFTYNLVDYFQQLTTKVVVVRNDVSLEEIKKLKPSGVVLSPGPGTPEKANQLLNYLDYFILKQIPILGICLGHQAIGVYFGATLCKAQKPMHGKVSNITHYKDEIFENVAENFDAVRYHSLILKNLPPILEQTCFTDNDVVMGIKHLTLPIYGIQFHPESILTNSGLKILENWLKLNNIKG